MDPLEPNLEPNLQPRNKVFRYILFAVFALVGLFVVSLFVSPILHPDHRITKVGVITEVATSGDPYFNQTVYTLTFQDGDVLRIDASNSVPFPVGKPVAITYSARGNQLLDVSPVPPSEIPPPAIPVHK